MNRGKYTAKEFVIKELAISIGAQGRAATWMPADTQPTPPSPISPIASVTAYLPYVEAVRGTIAEAIKLERYDDIARAFVQNDVAGNPIIRSAIHEIGSAVVASAAFASLGGENVGLPNPNCGGTSLETIPPTLTPIVHVGLSVHRVSELPRLKKQLAQTMAFVEKAAVDQAPHGNDVATVRAQLQEALNSLD